jgi:hypothetical protein
LPIGWKAGNFSFLEPSGPVKACNGTALPLPCYYVRGTKIDEMARHIVCMGAMRSVYNMLLEYLKRDVGRLRARSEVVD